MKNSFLPRIILIVWTLLCLTGCGQQERSDISRPDDTPISG